MKESKWPYLAGILDGEGTICMWNMNNAKGYQHITYSVVVYGTSLNLMKWLVLNFGGKYYLRTKTNLSKKPQYAWHPSGKKNKERILLGCLPYMVIKKEQAKVVLEFLRIKEQEKNPELRLKLLEKCKRLNREEESSTTNMMNNDEPEGDSLKIESELISDNENDPVVIQETI